MNLNQEYNERLRDAMTYLASKQDTVFLGQAVDYAGTGLYDTLSHLPADKKFEFPVAENFQVGYSIGLSLAGYVPISTFPRWNFLLCAADQIVNHLDKLEAMSSGGYRPKVIIRVAAGSRTPIDPQQQHVGDFGEAFRLMCNNIDIVQLRTHNDIIPAYWRAYESNRSTILVEYPDYGK